MNKLPDISGIEGHWIGIGTRWGTNEPQAPDAFSDFTVIRTGDSLLKYDSVDKIRKTITFGSYHWGYYMCSTLIYNFETKEITFKRVLDGVQYVSLQ